ncbi:hypothetical protein NOMA109596_05930 [Nocardioides marinus]|uniref:Uncharacterized protein n=1 Tax=Nocardioides marinus TaxID=374514 RepID=A0A7Z0C3D7_9ACTN|nr:hypothetical protein [Nocardioides marinus]NYI11033.1 hypothetical protein [Nocardioides marinus]
MTALHLLALTLVGALPLTERPRDQRGDVPGWVLVTVMSAGIVGVLTIVAQDELSSLLRRALRQVQ